MCIRDRSNHCWPAFPTAGTIRSQSWNGPHPVSYTHLLHNHEIYSYLIKFADDDGTCMTKQMLEENGDNTDPLKMNKEELFNYKRWTHL